VTATGPTPSTYHSSQRDSGALSMTMRRNGERGGLGARRIWMNGKNQETCEPRGDVLAARRCDVCLHYVKAVHERFK
jgi:hypothetical protein